MPLPFLYQGRLSHFLSAENRRRRATGTTPRLTQQFPYLQAKAYQEALKNNPLIAALGGLQNGNTPVLGVVAVKDTARVMSYFRMPQISRLLPRDLKLSWTVKPQIEGKDTRDNSDRYGLIALKVTSRNGQAPLSGNVITEARIDFDQTTNQTLVSMKMNSDSLDRKSVV